jgi:hypothetical protein
VDTDTLLGRSGKLFAKVAMFNATFPAGQEPARAGHRAATPLTQPRAKPDYWDELADALAPSAVDVQRLRREHSLVRAGVLFRIVAEDEGGEQQAAGLMVSLPLRVCEMDRDHLLRLLQTNALMAQTVGLVVGAGSLGELALVGTLGPQGPQAMVRWIEAAAWLAQSMLGGASPPSGAAEAPRELGP